MSDYRLSDVEQEKLARKEQQAKNMFFLGASIVHVVLLFVAWTLPPVVIFGTSISPLLVVVCVLAFVLTQSFETQQPDEVGGLLLFGRFLYQTEPGLIYSPPLVCKWLHESSTLQQFEIPGDLPEQYNNQKTIRVTTAPSGQTNAERSGSDDKHDPLNTGRLTLEGSFVIQARLDKRPGAFQQFIERIGSMDAFVKIADDLTVNRFSKEVIKRTPSQVLSQWEEIDRVSQESLEAKVGDYGFAELHVFAKGFDLPHRVNEALADRTNQHIGVETKRLEGLGEKQKNELVAVGVQALKKAEIAGTVDALVETKEKLGWSEKHLRKPNTACFQRAEVGCSTQLPQWQ